MGDINNTHGGDAAAAGATFPVAMYVLLLSYLALLLVPCSDLMHVLSLMCVVKYACASVILLSVIKLTRKLPNNLTYTRGSVSFFLLTQLKCAVEKSVEFV
jgi:chromate transport protein ChrA